MITTIFSHFPCSCEPRNDDGKQHLCFMRNPTESETKGLNRAIRGKNTF